MPKNHKNYGSIREVAQMLEHRVVRAVLIVLFAIVVIYKLIPNKTYNSTENEIQKDNQNQLVFKNEIINSSLAQSVQINKSANLDGQTYQSLDNLRKGILKEYGFIDYTKYKLSNSVYGNIDSKLNWITSLDWYFAGDRGVNRLPDNFQHKSAASFSILNPLVLVNVEFMDFTIWNEKNESWKIENINKEELIKGNFLFQPELTVINVNARSREIGVVYNVASFIREFKARTVKSNDWNEFRVSFQAHNARDFGYNYMSVDKSSVRNFNLPSENGYQPFVVTDRYLASKFSWLKMKFYNHFNRFHENLTGEVVTALPAFLRFKFWREEPTDYQRPDFTYTVTLQ